MIKVRRLRGRPIMLLGHDRSGSTWMGRTLGMAENVIYVHEPLVPNHGFVGNWNLYNYYIAKDAEVNDCRSVFDKATQGYGVRNVSREKILMRLFGSPRILIKETGGMMNGEWFQKHYNSRNIILIRHPAPLILSNIKMGEQNADQWLRKLLDQKAIQNEFLSDIPKDLSTYLDADVITKFAVIYAIRYRVALRQLERNPDWILVKYEKFCEHPVGKYERFYGQLGLNFSEEIRASITRDCTTDGSDSFYGTQRISSKNLTKWFEKCPPEDCARIREILEVFDFPYYRDEASWTPPAEQPTWSEWNFNLEPAVAPLGGTASAISKIPHQ